MGVYGGAGSTDLRPETSDRVYRVRKTLGLSKDFSVKAFPLKITHYNRLGGSYFIDVLVTGDEIRRAIESTPDNLEDNIILSVGDFLIEEFYEEVKRALETQGIKGYRQMDWVIEEGQLTDVIYNLLAQNERF